MTARARSRLLRYTPLAALAAVAVVFGALFLLPVSTVGQSHEPAAAAMATAEESPCLLPPPEMRRWHRMLLADERTAAVRHGKRDPEASLGRCITCHAVFDAAGQPVGYEDERHFCRACHRQVAVSVDCFSCHRSTPPDAQAEEAS